MKLPDELTLLQSALLTSPLRTDRERTWAFLVFCGLLEPSAHDQFVAQASATDDVVALSDGLLDFATPRAELLDNRQTFSRRLWQYFEVGRSLQAEGKEFEESTQPGAASPLFEPTA